jgi:hypothetical protein
VTGRNIAIAVAIVFGAASAASALEGRDSDNNSIPGYRGGAVHRGAPLATAGVFAGPRIAAVPTIGPFRTTSDWDRCLRSARQTCVH